MIPARGGPPVVPRHRDNGDGVPVVPWPSFEERVVPWLSFGERRVPSTGRVDIVAAIAGLRHLDASTEPALVFSHLAAVCVPAACDDVVIDLVEDEHGYRIRQPAAAPLPLRSAAPAIATSLSVGPVLGPHAVTVGIGAPERGAVGSEFTGTLVCTWRDGYQPSPADAALIGLMVDHAIALVHRERMTNRVTELEDRAQHLSSTMTRNRRIASAVGVVMALHHVNQAQAMDLLVRISDRTHRDLQDVADSVVHTCATPQLRTAEQPVGSSS